MADGPLALVLLIVFIGAVVLIARRRLRRTDNLVQGLPAELRSAEIAYAEKTFRSHRHRLVARLDRAYRTPEGVQLVELKTRSRDAVYLSDVIELSIQGIALQDETGDAVAPEAWVIVQNSRSGTRRPHRVRLLGRPEISAMRERYIEVVKGRVGRPAPARSPSLCSQCAHKARCASRYRDRS